MMVPDVIPDLTPPIALPSWLSLQRFPWGSKDMSVILLLYLEFLSKLREYYHSATKLRR